MAVQHAQTEKLVLRILTSCTNETPPMGSEMEILTYDSREGLNEEQAAIATGREMIVMSR